MNVIQIRTQQVEKQYQQYYEKGNFTSHSLKYGGQKSLRKTYSKDWIRLLSSNINNK